MRGEIVIRDTKRPDTFVVSCTGTGCGMQLRTKDPQDLAVRHNREHHLGAFTINTEVRYTTDLDHLMTCDKPLGACSICAEAFDLRRVAT